MLFRKKPVLLPAGSDLCAVVTDDLDNSFADMVEACFAPPVQERTEMAFENRRDASPQTLLRKNLITRGQWLLLLAEGFDFEMENGGLAQFIVNKPDWVGEIPMALEALGLGAFRDAYVETVNRLEAAVDGFRPSGGGSLLSILRDTNRLEEQLREHTDDGLIDRNYTMRWDEGSGTTVWDDEQWSRQLKRRMIDWVAEHPEEFRKTS
ncbi:hypothetical protein [Oricola sp.]|uniref:DMP19 family protein n=1 Tax=Oricola sp. TaxID=1979950 RepID=UPI0025FE5789|nr:hypothetical protein [Oricola sp.]MCI5077766.1 hypothetical protein [Oricola sp.]